MDFTLSLTHFCEAHGPKSVLCTQVLPLECTQCWPPSPPLRPQHSTESLSTQIHPSSEEPANSIASLRRADTNSTLPTDFSGASTTVDSDPESPSIERHPLFKPHESDTFGSPQYRYGRAQGETCASCSFTAPSPVTSKLPSGAPGSLKSDGKKQGAPVFRSREFMCLGTDDQPTAHASSSHRSHDSSLDSYAHPDDCHDHTLTYLTAKSPEHPSTFALLRSSVIRTLSCELLPRGTSDGPLCFGDSNAGYTIAYVFRLTDPKARGKRRAYAFLALAGTDASRAFRACPIIWEAFASMADAIETAAQTHQEAQQRKDEQEFRTGKKNYTPPSSFLTQRNVDPDGMLRRVGVTSPRSLAEIVGDENVFARLHQFFVALLRCLGDKFGGLPVADQEHCYQSLVDETGSRRMPLRIKSEAIARLRDDDATPTPTNQAAQGLGISTLQPKAKAPVDEIDVVKNKNRLSKTISISSSCAPLIVGEGVQRQVVV